MEKNEPVDLEEMRRRLNINLGWCWSFYLTNDPNEMFTFLRNWANGKNILLNIENGIVTITVPATKDHENDRHVVLYTKMSFDSRDAGNIRSLSLLMTILESEISHGNLTGIVNISGKRVDVTNLPKGTIFIDLNERFEFGCCFNQSPGGGTVEALKNFTEKDVQEGYTAYRITADDTAADALRTIATFLWTCNLEISLHSISGGCLYKANAVVVINVKDVNTFEELAHGHGISVQKETTCPKTVLDSNAFDIIGAIVACPNDQTYQLISLGQTDSSLVAKYTYYGGEEIYNKFSAIWQLAGANITPIVKCMPLNGDNKTAFDYFCWAYKQKTGQRPETNKVTTLPIANVVSTRTDLRTICVGTNTDELGTALEVIVVFLDNNLKALE